MWLRSKEKVIFPSESILFHRCRLTLPAPDRYSQGIDLWWYQRFVRQGIGITLPNLSISSFDFF
jgi:hypothetical protein